MTWPLAEQIGQLSRANEPMPEDIIFSGTPANVGPAVPGDGMEGAIAGPPTLNVKAA